MEWNCKLFLNCPQSQTACGYYARQSIEPCASEIKGIRQRLEGTGGGRIVAKQTAENFNRMYEHGAPAVIRVFEIIERNERCRITNGLNVVPENPSDKVIDRGRIVNGRFLPVS